MPGSVASGTHCISAPCFVGRYCLHFEVTELSQVDAELIWRNALWWVGMSQLRNGEDTKGRSSFYQQLQ